MCSDVLSQRYSIAIAIFGGCCPTPNESRMSQEVKIVNMEIDHKLSLSLLNFITNCVGAYSENDDITQVLSELNSILPFESAVIVIDTELNFSLKAPQQVVTYKLNLEWLDEYFKNKYYQVDPVLEAVMNSPAAVYWPDVYATASPKSLAFIKASTQYVGNNGISILKKSKQGSTLISLFMKNGTIEKTWLPIIEYITPHIHAIFNREGEYQRKSLWKPKLTERELEVLNLVKNGKSNWDISQILAISERTVKYHLSNIYEKLSVVNRSQSIAQAIHHGIIST